MALYPPSFIEELRSHIDIVQVIQDYVPLRQVGGTYKGLCPFHAEKTPSFNVNRDKGFFHCFGCGAGGDAFKFLELQEKLSFPDVVKQLAQRFGVTLPTTEEAQRDRALDAERETLLRAHELAAAYYRDQLQAPIGRGAREHLVGRALSRASIERLGFGYAPEARDGLRRHLESQGIPLAMGVRSGLLVEREHGVVDRFRHRLMVPISRESGSIVAFGGRALGADQQPKYLNSPETPIYSKSRVLYGLNLTKQEIRKQGLAVLVEGYFDFAQALQAGVTTVVATCGTALTRQQAQMLRRFSNKVTLSFDPDTAGQGAVVKSSDLLVQEGFGVSVAVLPTGMDPDTFVRKQGGAAYTALVAEARPYLDHLLELAAATHDFTKHESRRAFLESMLQVAAGIPDAASRDQFADRVAHRARVSEEVVRQEIRRAAVARRTTLPPVAVGRPRELKAAERDLLSALVARPQEALDALEWLEDADFEGLTTTRIFSEARLLRDLPAERIPTTLLERLSEEETALLALIAAPGEAALTPLTPLACARTLRRLRYERERAVTQREIRQLQDEDAVRHAGRIVHLQTRKMDLARKIEDLAN
ncbi:MAG: DNA primase [Vicinamibacterales bacterium]